MKQALAKAQIEAEVTSQVGNVFTRGEKLPADFVSSGVPEIDALTGGGLPRGAIMEMFGTASSGRISLLCSALSNATSNHETCALIDTSDTFDPASAANARVNWDRLLWVRCGNSLERAFKATDLLLQSGGFGLVALNLADVGVSCTRRIMSSWWFRFRRAVESTPTALVVITPGACVRSCAAVVLEMKSESSIWPRTMPVDLENARLIAREDIKQSIRSRQLSLVGDSHPKVKFQSSLTHAQLLCGINIRVDRAKPTSWSERTARFSARSPATRPA